MTSINDLGKQLKNGQTHSLWIDTSAKTNFSSLQPDLTVDTAVLGGGIAGLTTALLLKEAGQKVAVIEARRIVEDTTGHTTAKITALHGFIYQQITNLHSKAYARLYAEANIGALDFIKNLVEQKKIDCSLEKAAAYSYTESEQNLTLIEDEVAACKKAGLKANYTEDTPLPFPVAGAVYLENQAQFHPRKYLLALANEINGNGSFIFEETRALDIIENKSSCTISTNKGEITAKRVVVATHFPFYDKGFFYARLYPYRAYAIGLRIKEDIPGGMYYCQDGPHHSIRNYVDTKGPLLIVGGGYHRSGQVTDTLKKYKGVLNYAGKRFAIQSIDYYWSTMDYRTLDNLPYVGKSPQANRIYIAAGFGAWGMTNGTLAGLVISDQIQGRKNKYSELLKPERISLARSVGNLASQNMSVMETYFKGLFSRKKSDLSNLPVGEAKVVKIGGKKIAAFRDDSSKLHTISAICSHMGCTVNWNNAERTWDCPCHGSRFSYNGKVIHGPALQDLPEKSLE